MALSAGTRFGAYEVVASLGAGGMGEVHRARDTKLNRDVALKVLPEAFASDRERMARFEREARVLASLNHPGIAAIHGLEDSGTTRALVMELVEGQTLAERVGATGRSPQDVLDIARQIAEALEYAHEKGIIHRDLKPANIKITPEGQVKLLDFGLAKALESPQDSRLEPQADLSQSPTLSMGATQTGVILGTAAYMAPEQARGKAVDRRADIWAFGVVLYEMLAGRRPFQGEDASETLAAVIKEEPDWTAIPAGTPPAIVRLLHRCLIKDSKQRLQAIGEARIAIGECANADAIPAEASSPPRRSTALRLAAGTAIVLFAGILIGRQLTQYLQPSSPAALVKSTIKLESGRGLAGNNSSVHMRPSQTAVAISSNGSFLVYSAADENPSISSRGSPWPAMQRTARLFLRRMDQSEATDIPGTEGGNSPFLSPDNRWVGYIAENKLKKIAIEGGVPTILCALPQGLVGAYWTHDNQIVFAGGLEAGLSRVSADGGKPETLTTPDPKREEISHRLPLWLPNGKAVVFTVLRHSWDKQPWLSLLRLDTREWQVLIENAADARYLPTGHLVFLRAGTLMAVRFDLARLEVVGQPVPVVGNVMQAFSFNLGSQNNSCAGQFSISDTGSLIYAAGGLVPDLKNSLVWVDQEGREQPAADLQFPFFRPRMSPDGQRIAYQTTGQAEQIWVYDCAKGTNTQLTREGRAGGPIWAPDGRRLAFYWHKSLTHNLFWQSYDGGSPMERLVDSRNFQHAGSWSPDGKVIAVAEWDVETNTADISVLDIPSKRITPFLNTPLNETYPELSPDGRWMAYATGGQGIQRQVFVVDFPGKRTKHPISGCGGDEPLWSRDGRKLFYRNGDQMWVVDVMIDGGFTTSKPRLLFERPGYANDYWVRNYDLSADSQRFLMVKVEQRKPTPVTELTLVQNWFEELKRLVPGGK